MGKTCARPFSDAVATRDLSSWSTLKSSVSRTRDEQFRQIGRPAICVTVLGRNDARHQLLHQLAKCAVAMFAPCHPGSLQQLNHAMSSIKVGLMPIASPERGNTTNECIAIPVARGRRMIWTWSTLASRAGFAMTLGWLGASWRLTMPSSAAPELTTCGTHQSTMSHGRA